MCHVKGTARRPACLYLRKGKTTEMRSERGRGVERQVTNDLVDVHSGLFRFYKLAPRPPGSQSQVAFDVTGPS